MRKLQRKIQVIVGLVLCLLAGWPAISFAQNVPKPKKKDSTELKFLNPYFPNFRVRDRHGDPFSNYTTSSPLFLKDTKNLKTEITIDSNMRYNISEKFGNVRFRPNSVIPFQDFSTQQDLSFRKNYYKSKSLVLDGESAVSSRNLLPKIYLSPILDRIFGGSTIEFIPKGNVTLDLGGSFQKIENPAIPIRQQRNGGLVFDQQIQLALQGKVGQKLKISTNFNTNNSFNFQNPIKVEYGGLREDLLKKLEIGNVSLPLNNSLIKGAQNLFGVKAQLQFGKLTATVMATSQRGKQSTIHINGSGNGVSQGRPFEIVASNYDENRHFFLAQFFRDNFFHWATDIPGQISSGLNITRIEVYSINRQNTTSTLRDVVAFMDMGETDKIYRKHVITQVAANGTPPAFVKPQIGSESNNLYDILKTVSADKASITTSLTDKGLSANSDFIVMQSARKLDPTEYILNAQFGYITLQRKLQNDEGLAVSYEYTYNGRNYKVGQLTEDYSSNPTNDVIYMKMLRPLQINIKDNQGAIYPSWNLMMKNIYNLSSTNLTKDGFQLRVIYRDDRTGIDNPQLQDGDPPVRAQQLVSALGLDRLNPNGDPQPDGNFDYLEGITINSALGLIIVPYVEPFNTALRRLFDPPYETNANTRAFLLSKYLYDTLYHDTQTSAALVNTKNKFYFSGSIKSGTGRDILIQGAFSLTPGSVKVYSGGTPLREGVDYSVDYTFGKVTLLNEGILNSGKSLDITYEQQDPFSFQTRSLLGTRLDYKLNEDVNLGATVLYYDERPLITRNSIGSEPARNIQYGLDINLKKNSRLLTKMVDALPFIQTKEPSSITVNAEVAQLLPGSSNKVQGQATSFIDDFENAATPYSLLSPLGWKLAATPSDPTYDKTNGVVTGSARDLVSGYQRAKLSWFQIDNIFYVGGTSNFAPPSINLNNHYQRPVAPQEVFPFFDNFVGNFYQPVLNLAYYPTERGPYNYNPNLDGNGHLLNPTTSWAGITTAIKSNVDFDAANIEYLEFWMMDPFIQGNNGTVLDGVFNANNTDGGNLSFHLGNISEDVGRDGQWAFENGLPVDGNISAGVNSTSPWGYVTTKQYLNNAFDNSPTSRPNQDIGIDGLSTLNERTDPKFQSFINAVNPSAKAAVLQDPSADDFQYYLGQNFDDNKTQVLERYKNFNGLENNSPIITGAAAFAAAGTTLPDNEDINNDNLVTDSKSESYYAYNINLKPNQLRVGNKYIVDQIQPQSFPGVTWYLFRIPLRSFDGQVGNINGFKSIKFMRMVMNGFSKPVVLRMVNFRLVSQKWRQYTGNLLESVLTEVPEPNLDNFTVSTVNVEENGQPDNSKPGYVPPLARDYDVTSVTQRRLNEQSVQLCVTSLKPGDGRAIYKNVSLDLFNYKRVRMFISVHGAALKSNQKVMGFLRLGTDWDQNYYEIQLPLTITPVGTNDQGKVWPEQNQIDLSLDDLSGLKIARDREVYPLTIPYPQYGPKQLLDGKHAIRVLGRPDLSQVKVVMIGIRNPRDGGQSFDACLWADELRLAGFDQTAGWAANAVVSAKLADLGTVTGSYRHIGFGYGGVQTKISERARGNTNQFDLSMNLNLDKLLPRNTGLKIPLFFSYESIIIDPKYDPANPDLRINAALNAYNTQAERNAYLSQIRDISTRRSINFTNVRKVKVKKDAVNHIYDIENFTFTYLYTEANQHNFNILENTRRNIKGSVAWQYQSKFKGFLPFKNVKFTSSKYLQLLKDFNFNPVPSTISVRGDVERSFNKIAYRNNDPTAITQLPNYQKYFTFNRFYNFSWGITKSLKVDYNATVNAIIDEPAGDINTKLKRDSIIKNLKRLGRIKYFEQNVNVIYTLPLDKFPGTNWINADYKHTVGYNWRAGPLQTVDSLKTGNTIQNTRNQGVNAKFDFVKLYNKLDFFKEINSPKPKPPPPKNEAERRKRALADTVPHPPELKLLKAMLRLIMSLRSINATYLVTEGTILPGFSRTPKLFGLDQSWLAPGLGFVLGQQDINITQQAAANGWLIHNKRLTTPFSQTQTKDLTLRANLEPFNDFKIQLDARKTSNASFQEIFKDTTGLGNYAGLSPSRSGSYKISFISVGTAFKNNNALNSEVFNEFKSNITILQNRFKRFNGGDYLGQAQDVTIPAFIAAYSGRSARTSSLSSFPSIPLPNWRLDYSGLTKLEPFKSIFTSVVLSHAYTSSYSVANYSNSLLYNNLNQLGISNTVENYNVNPSFSATQYTQTTQAGATSQLVPIFVISQVLISETFAPLIGINVKTKSKLSITFNYKTKRDISLNVPNAQVTEVNGKDWSVELGYTKNNLRLPFRNAGRIITLKNDITFRLTMGVTSNVAIQRRIDQGSSITNGNINFQFRPNISYAISKKLQLQFYIDRNTNNPLVSNSFYRATTRGGFKLIFIVQ